MMKAIYVFLAAATLILFSLPAHAMSVTLWKPTDQGFASEHVQIRAFAQPDSGHTITGWIAYFNNVNDASGGASQWFGATVNLTSPGSYHVVVTAWETGGTFASASINITVVANATDYSDIQSFMTGWGTCGGTCSGGSGNGTFSFTQGNVNPSLASDSIEFQANGVNADALFYNKFGANDSVHNFVWDWWFFVDSSIVNEQAIESDIFQFVSGEDYMMGFQADFNSGTWDVWNEAAGHWVNTPIAVSKFAPNTWHHMTLYAQTDTTNKTYNYVKFIFDGQEHSLTQYTFSPLLHPTWNDEVGVQYQLDPNGGGGNCFEWSDLSDLTAW